MVVPPQNCDFLDAADGRRGGCAAPDSGDSSGGDAAAIEGPVVDETGRNRIGLSSGPVRRMPVGVAMAILIPALAFGGVLIGFAAVNWWGPAATTSALLASLICIAGSILGLMVGSLVTGPQAVNGLLLGLFCRMSLALGAGMVAMIGGKGGNGFLECLVANYLFSLAIDTVLAVRMLPSTRVLRGT
ncbi:MAG: hypothetical protein FJ295_01750 [Planctomycetes bacterium]|nr:hypothetical protein [Planctomycetota bacterium]